MWPVFADLVQAAAPVRLEQWDQDSLPPPFADRRPLRLDFRHQQLGVFVRDSTHATHSLPSWLPRHQLSAFQTTSQ